jgi:hypothetical protein
MPLTFDRSPDTADVIAALRGVNGEISYKDLAKQAGVSIPRLKQVLPSARRVLFAENEILFGCVWGQGLRRMTDQDKVRKPEAFKKRVFRGAGRELKHLESIDLGRLSKSDQHITTTNRTILELMRREAQVKTEAPAPMQTAPKPLPNMGRLVPKRSS